jgi:hypothetical protein
MVIIIPLGLFLVYYLIEKLYKQAIFKSKCTRNGAPVITDTRTLLGNTHCFDQVTVPGSESSDQSSGTIVDTQQ